MNSIVINWAGSGEVRECLTMEDAENAIESRHEDVVYADQWDSDGVNDDDEPMERLLFWADEESAANDSGTRSLGYLSRMVE